MISILDRVNIEIRLHPKIGIENITHKTSYL